MTILNLLFSLALPLLVFIMHRSGGKIISKFSAIQGDSENIPNCILHSHVRNSVLGYELSLTCIPFFIIYLSLKKTIIRMYPFLKEGDFDICISILAVLVFLCTLVSLRIACDVRKKENEEERRAKIEYIKKTSVSKIDIRHIDPSCATLNLLQKNEPRAFNRVKNNGFKVAKNTLFEFCTCNDDNLIISKALKLRALSYAIGSAMLLFSIFYFPIINFVNGIAR